MRAFLNPYEPSRGMRRDDDDERPTAHRPTRRLTSLIKLLFPPPSYLSRNKTKEEEECLPLFLSRLCVMSLSAGYIFLSSSHGGPWNTYRTVSLRMPGTRQCYYGKPFFFLFRLLLLKERWREKKQSGGINHAKNPQQHHHQPGRDRRFLLLSCPAGSCVYNNNKHFAGARCVNHQVAPQLS